MTKLNSSGFFMPFLFCKASIEKEDRVIFFSCLDNF